MSTTDPGELLKDPEYVTQKLEKHTCPRCGAEGPLRNHTFDKVICQVCALRCLRITNMLFVAETPPIEPPALTLREWFKEALFIFGAADPGKVWINYVGKGKWMHHWRHGMSPYASALRHKIENFKYEPVFHDIIYSVMWPIGLVLGYELNSIYNWRTYVDPVEEERSAHHNQG